MASTKHGVIAPGVFMVQNTTDRDALGTDDNLVAGESLCVVLGEGIYRCDTAAAASSTWSSKTTGNATFEGDVSLSGDSPVATVGGGGGSPRLTLDKSDAGTATLRWAKAGTREFEAALSATEELVFVRAPGGTFADQTTYGTSGWTFPAAVNITGALNHDGSTVGFYGTAPAAQSAAYTRNATVVEDRTLLASASATTTNNNNVLAALIADLQAVGLIA